jgi:hypothetical protein
MSAKSLLCIVFQKIGRWYCFGTLRCQYGIHFQARAWCAVGANAAKDAKMFTM